LLTQQIQGDDVTLKSRLKEVVAAVRERWDLEEAVEAVVATEELGTVRERIIEQEKRVLLLGVRLLGHFQEFALQERYCRLHLDNHNLFISSLTIGVTNVTPVRRRTFLMRRRPGLMRMTGGKKQFWSSSSLSVST
jgi:hypothetical protein